MISKLLPPKFYLKSYSQEGEDIILSRYFEGRKPGFYVDVGAHHPKRFSNTYYFYTRGWRGINIDATPRSLGLFKKLRPKDINILAAISNKKGVVDFYEFNEPALNTLNQDIALSREKIGYKIIKKSPVALLSLEEIFDRHLPSNQQIDFMSIDIEGEDLNALKSNNWNRYQPHIILIEILSPHEDYAYSPNSEIEKYLNKFEYSFFAKSMNTYFFKREP